VYVFGVGPLVDQVNINALASKKDNEQHVFKVKDMENLEDVFFQMIGRNIEEYKETVRKLGFSQDPLKLRNSPYP
jgi:hypothetical protein